MFLKNALAYSGTSFLAQGISLVENLVVRRILPPAAVGLLEFALLVQNVVTTFDPGIGVAARFELPRLAGAGAREAEHRVRATALSATLALGILQAVAILVYAVVFVGRMDERWTSTVAASAIVLPASLGATLITLLQGKQRYVALSRACLLHALSSGVLLPSGAYWWGASGLLFAAVLAALVQPLLLATVVRAERLYAGLSCDGSTLKRLLGFGAPLRLVDSPQALMPILDTLFISSLLGLGPLAVYAIVKSCFMQAVAVTGPAWNVFLTRMFHLTGATADRAAVAAETRTVLLVQNLVLNPLLIALMIPAYQFLVLRFIPSYSESVSLMGIFACSMYFLPQTTQIRNFWMLDKKLVPLGVSNLVGLVSMTAAILLVVQARGASLPTIAAGTVFGYFGYYLYIMLTIGRDLWGLRGALHVVAESLLSLAATKLVIDHVPAAVTEGDLASQLWQLSSAWVLSLLALAPLAIYGVWRTNIVTYLRRDLRRSAGSVGRSAFDSPEDTVVRPPELAGRV